MKNLLSNISGRPLALLLPAVLIASALVPATASAIVFISTGGGGGNGMDGDPLDTNDYGGGGGGSDIHNSSAGGSTVPPVLEIGNIQIFMVTDFIGGKVFFKLLAVEKPEANLVERSVEGTHAQ